MTDGDDGSDRRDAFWKQIQEQGGYAYDSEGRFIGTLMPPEWSCDNYTKPHTCLSVGCTTPCDRCRARVGPE